MHCSRGMYLPWGVYLPGGVIAQGVGVYLPGMYLPRYSPLREQNDWQTGVKTFAGGNNEWYM